MAKAKLQQIKLASGNHDAQPPFPGGWVVAIFDALRAFDSELATKHDLPISQSTQERIKAGKEVKQSSYSEIEDKLVELLSALFPKVSAVNGFARKYVDEYFRLWKKSAEIAPIWVKSLGLVPAESSVLGRAFVRDLILRLCYLESCERRLNNAGFDETELSFLRHDTPTQVYQNLIKDLAQARELSQEKLAEELGVSDDGSLRRIKRGEAIPQFNLLLKLKPTKANHRLLASIGFVDQLLKDLGLQKSILRHELLPVASVFFRIHPAALEIFGGKIPQKQDSGEIQEVSCDFEGYIAYGDYGLLHPGFDKVWPEMPDALWRAHVYSLRFGSIVELAQAYFQFAQIECDEGLVRFLEQAEKDSQNCAYHWKDKLWR